MELRNIVSVILLHIVIPAKGRADEECPELVQETGYYASVYESTCYMFVDKEEFWKEASSHCLQMGGDLVTIKNAGVMNFLKKQLNSKDLGWSNNGVWIGARYYESKQWVWTTGEKVRYNYWAPGEPSKTLGLFKIENCALMRREDGWRWHDYHCGTLKFHYKYICQFPIAHSYREDGQSAHSAAAGQHEDNGNMSILLVVIGLAGLVIFGMLVVFFIYKKRQRDKPYDDTIVRFENRSYGPISQNENPYSIAQPDQGNQRPISNMYMSPEEVHTLYEEVQKNMYHGVNNYHKDTNCLAAAQPPLPPPRSDSASGTSSVCEGAVGGQDVECASSYEEPTKNPLMGGSMISEAGSELKGGNLYVDMSGGSKSSLETDSSSLEKKKLEPTYTNTVEMKSECENHYEDLPVRK